jgi:hypothetical protein
MQDFIGEDNLQTFEGWLRYLAVDPTRTVQMTISLDLTLKSIPAL